MKPPKGLFVGRSAHLWQSGFQRLHALRSLAVEMENLSEPTPTLPSRNVLARVRRSWARDIFSPWEIQAYNALLLHRLNGPPPDFVWCEWPVKMEATTLSAIKERWPGCMLVCFQDDNPFGNRTGEGDYWRRFLANLPLYDVHFVKRESDVTEYLRRGAANAHLLMHGVYEPLFHPDPRPAADSGFRWPVSFVGTAFDHRIGIITDLLASHRVPLQVFGGKWRQNWVGLRHWGNFSPIVFGEAYVHTLWASGISLGFVSSSNRDEYSMRTFEIPGCAGFMLAERTPKHLDLFAEGLEAEFFSTTEECAAKIRFYLNDETARRRIALAGYARCIRSNYGLTHRMREAMEVLFPGQFRPTRNL